MECEENIDARIREYQKKFGVIDEGLIVSDDDYERTVSFEEETREE